MFSQTRKLDLVTTTYRINLILIRQENSQKWDLHNFYISYYFLRFFHPFFLHFHDSTSFPLVASLNPDSFCFNQHLLLLYLFRFNFTVSYLSI